MATWMKKLSLAMLAALLAAFTIGSALMASVPPEALADPDDAAEAEGAAETPGDTAEDATPSGNCTVTLEYYENVGFDNPDIPVDDEGRFHLGTRTLTNLSVGDELNTWDYVVDIPGFFFFDAWPARLTVSADPAENVIKLFYFKRYDNEYTVNYYVMSGANLAADNWHDALDTNDVHFTKIGSETFGGQSIGTLVEGAAYEYKIDGTYVVDTYPAEIRIGTNPDNNVINVLYTPEDEYPGDTGGPDAAPPADLPDDTVTDVDGIVGMLPDDTQETDELYQDFVGWNDRSADEAALGQTGDQTGAWLVGTVVVATALMGGLALLARLRTRKHADS